METSLPWQFWLAVFFFLLIVFSLLYFYFTKLRPGTKEDRSYLLGLKSMAEGESRLAVEKFKEAVRHDSENIDAYIKIGVLLRNEGLAKNAIRIHKDLTLRGNLKPTDLIEIKRQLALDYWQAKDYGKAEVFFEEVKSDKIHADWATPFLLKIHEKKQDWNRAYNLYRSHTQANTSRGKAKMAMYKVLEGIKLTAENNEKGARVLFKEALKINVSCSAAYLYCGDSYWREERTDDAIQTWTDLCNKVPGQAYLAFKRLEKAWYEKGKYSKIEELYQGIIAEDGSDRYAVIALAEIYRKKGDFAEAIKLLESAQKKDIDPNLVQAHLIKVLIDKENFKEGSKLALEMIDQSYQAVPKTYACEHCLSKFEDPFWICEECGEWNQKLLKP